MPNKATSSGVKTANGVINAAPACLTSVAVVGVSSVIRVWDNASAASGLVLAEITTGAGDAMNAIVFDWPVSANNGIYLEVVSGTCRVVVTFLPN